MYIEVTKLFSSSSAGKFPWDQLPQRKNAQKCDPQSILECDPMDPVAAETRQQHKNGAVPKRLGCGSLFLLNIL